MIIVLNDRTYSFRWSSGTSPQAMTVYNRVYSKGQFLFWKSSLPTKFLHISIFDDLKPWIHSTLLTKKLNLIWTKFYHTAYWKNNLPPSSPFFLSNLQTREVQGFYCCCRFIPPPRVWHYLLPQEKYLIENCDFIRVFWSVVLPMKFYLKSESNNRLREKRTQRCLHSRSLNTSSIFPLSKFREIKELNRFVEI